MANKKISELPLINTLSGSEAGGTVIPVVVGGTTAQISAENFRKFMTLPVAQTGSANTFTANQTITQNLLVGGTSTLTGNTSIGGNLVVGGRITAEEFHTEITTASVIYSSGSTKFGDTSDDTHQFTGSIQIGGETLGNGGLNTATASLNTFTGSLSAFYQATASINAQLARIQQATASLELASSSLQRLYQTSASLQTFTSSQDDRNFVLGIVTGSINRATASIQSQTASLLAFTASQDSRNFTLSQVTASFNYFYQATASLQTFTSSQADRNLVLSIVTGSINQATESLQFQSASVNAQLGRIQQATASLELASASFKYFYQSTASLQTFTASQADRNLVLSIVTGSINQATRSLELHSGSMIGITNGLMAFTSSLRPEINSIEAYTASLKNSTIVSSSTQIFTGYDYEIHVSQVDGNDTTGNGDLLTPVASITKALQIVSSSYLSTDRRTIIIHPGTYTESPTVTLANTYIFALGLLGANTAIAGTLTINAACRVSGIKMTNLVVNTTSAVYINNTTVDTQMTVTNTGYLETTGCSFQCPSGVTVSGAAPGVVFNSTTLWGLVVNNASAVVVVRNSPQVLVATVTAGNLALSNTLLFSSTPTGNAITTSAGSVVTLSNLNILDNTALAVARVSLSGFYSIIDVVYDKPNSTLVALSGTGGPLNAIDYFQYINADKFVTQGGTGYQFLKGDGSLDSIMPSSLQQTTASLNLTTGSLIGITNGLMALTASMKNSTIVSSSNQIPELFTLMQATASLNTTTGSFSAIVNQILQTTASLNSKTGSYITTGSNGQTQSITGSLAITGSIFISGSVYGNTTSQSVASNTASLDFTAANFFMVQLGSSVTTHISASNLRAGQSVNVLVTTGTNSTASFSPNVRQPSGSFYLPTSGSGKKDILSFVSFDASNLYLVAVNQMI
jgi:hypothetical protein